MRKVTTRISRKVLLSIKRDLRNHRDKDYRKSAFRFFKEKVNPVYLTAGYSSNGVKIIGVRSKVVKKIAARQFWEMRHLKKKEIFYLCEKLLKSGHNEEEAIAFYWLYRLRNRFEQEDFTVFERWLKKYVSNWASCDDFCTHAFGNFIFQHPKFLPQVKRWAVSKNRWLRRASAVILIYPVRRKKYLHNIFETADMLLLDTDDLVQKGYGWMLKEAGNLYPREVFQYVMLHKDRMPRTALRYSIEKFPKTWKRRAMKI